MGNNQNLNNETSLNGKQNNEKKKKGFILFFELFFRNFWKLLTVSLWYDLLCLPLVTNGLAAVGMANVTRNISRGKHSFGTSDFFETIKKNWKQALPVGIINLVFTLLTVLYVWLGYRGLFGKTGGTVLMGVGFFCLFIFSIMKYYMPLLMITFSFSNVKLYTNSFRFVLINLPKNFLLMLCLLLSDAVLVVVYSYLGVVGRLIAILLFITVLPAFRSLLIQFNVFEPIKKYIIEPYYKENPEKDVEKRLALGLDVDPQYLPDGYYDSVFSD